MWPLARSSAVDQEVAPQFPGGQNTAMQTEAMPALPGGESVVEYPRKVLRQYAHAIVHHQNLDPIDVSTHGDNDLRIGRR